MTRNVGRYAPHGPEVEFEPGSHSRVLRNLLGIRSKREMARAESDALLSAQERLVERFLPDHRFVSDDIREIHRVWLGGVYPWAGDYRTVNVGKGGFQFAAAREVARLMREFEQRELATYTPCRFSADPDIARALAVVHAELVIIHPFREGNGRCARLLALLMAFQAELPPLDFGGWSGKGERDYIAAVQAAVGSNYEPMIGLFSEAIGRSYDRFGRRGR